MTRYNYIDKNFSEVKKLVRNGMISPTDFNDYHVYKCYLKHKHIKIKMKIYKMVGIEMGMSVVSVMRAIKRTNSILK